VSWVHRNLGKDGVTQLAIDPLFFAARASLRPLEYGNRGIYRLSVVTGTLAAALAASAQLYQFKWTDATNLAIILKLRTRFLPLTPFTAATLTDHTSFDAFKVSTYAGGGGGTSLTLTGNNAKTRATMAASLAAINVATTAALTAATTLDAQPFAQSIRKGNRVNPAAATEEVIMPVLDGLAYEPDVTTGEMPLVLAQNEGVVVRNRTVWPAAGTGILLIETVWAEVPAY
jgi:hypothetical protein